MWRYHRFMHWLKYSNPWIKFKNHIKYGTFDSVEAYNVSDFTAMFMLPRLKEMKAGLMSYPANMTSEQWNEILSDIIIALELQLNPDRGFCGEQAEKDRMTMEHGFNLMAKHWLSLWD